MNGLGAYKRHIRTTGAVGMMAQSVADILGQHVKLSVEGIDRMYLNVYVPRLQTERGVVWFFREHRGQPLPSAALMSPMSRSFVAKLEGYVAEHEVPLVQFRKGQRKDTVMAEHLRKFDKEEGVVFVGKAQEKTPVFRTEKRRSPTTGQPYPWIVRSTAMVNHYYIYAVDRDFGPFFLKFCTYFPFNAKLCLNGHEYAKRQLARKGIAFEALDNGVLSCARAPAPAANLRRPWPREDRRPAAQVAASPAAPVHRRGPQSRLPLRHLYPAGRVFIDPGARPAPARPSVLRTGDPREPRSRPSRRGATDLQSQDHPQDAGAVPHPHPDARRHPVLERLLQEHPDQAVPQGKPGLAHRDHHQQQLRFRHRQAPAQSAQAARGRLCGQSPAPRSRAPEPRLHARRRHLPDHQQPGRSRPPTRLRPALCRSARPSAPACAHPIPPDRRRIPLSRSAPPSGRPVRPRSRSDLPRRRHISTSPPASPWLDRTPAQQLSIPRHRIRLPRSAVLHPRLQPHPASRIGRRTSRPPRHQRSAQARLRQNRHPGHRMDQQRSTRSMKLDTFTPSVVTQAELVQPIAH